jgi:hypothetical protein
MAREKGVHDPTTRHNERDESGRFTSRSASDAGEGFMNRIIREAAGRAG